MCGVLGITIEKFNNEDGDLVRRLFQQSMIRGKHATGVSYIKDNKVHTIKDSIPANDFIEQQDINSWVNEDANLYCISHIRYSTSDLRYNQPFATDKVGIVHNGVISQEPYSTWFEKYGYVTETANDSELVLKAFENNDNPLQVFHPASMAVCTIDKNKKLTAFRNETRPLYYYSDPRMTVFASTADILKRSGLDSEKTEMYRIYTVEEFTVSSIGITTNIKDLQ